MRVAIKTIFSTEPELLLREINSLEKVNHINVIKLLDITKDVMQQIVLVMEYVPIDLRTVIRKSDKPFSLRTIRNYAKGLFGGLEYLHSINIIHRDIKPANILVDDDEILKICDLGLSKVQTTGANHTRQVGTLLYQAPELLFGASKYNQKVDIWVSENKFMRDRN